ncbi:MBL fold metallo-hydrolase [Deinococcus radiodurans]|uniref:MBL fold metallo-hydrolase n=1 Tax=Deinococcus radiodurans TaxID=1299 RepID=UPI000A78777B
MFFERFYDTDLAQASYMVGCQRTGECLVIDPVRDVQQYLEKAASQRLRVTHVTETHIHADYLSGSRELAAATGAQLLLPGEGGAEWRYDFGDQKLHHGDVFWVGNVKVEVRHTPATHPRAFPFW